MEAFLGCIAIAAVLALHGLDFLKELKCIRQELEKLNAKQDVSTSAREPGSDDPLAKACFRYLVELQYLVENGEASEEVLTHIDSCEACRSAIHQVMENQGKQLQKFAKDLREDS